MPTYSQKHWWRNAYQFLQTSFLAKLVDECSPLDNIDGGIATNPFQIWRINVLLSIVLMDECQVILKKMDGEIPTNSFPH